MRVSGSSRARFGAGADGVSAGSGGSSKRAVISAVEPTSRHRQRGRHRNESSLRGITQNVAIDDSEIERILCINAHPDDVDFGSAGTIAGWTAQGIEVRYCIVTNG